MNIQTKFCKTFNLKSKICKHAVYGYDGEDGTWYFCKKDDKACWTYPNGNAKCVDKGYPTITDTQYLKIVAVMNKHELFYELLEDDYDKLKEEILTKLLDWYDEYSSKDKLPIKEDIQKIFEEE